MNNTFIDTAVVTAIQDDCRSRAELHRSTANHSPTSRSIVARLWTRSTSADRTATRETAPVAVGRMAQATQGVHP